MSVVVYCPSCQSKIRAPNNVMGRQVKCPSCHTTFPVGGVPASDAPAPASSPRATSAEASPFGQLDEGPSPDLRSDREAPRRSIVFVDYLLFRRMITPIFIQILFWLAVITTVAASGIMLVIGIIILLNGDPNGLVTILLSLVTLFVGPLVLRIYCEMMILFFRMNETLVEVRNTVDRLAQR